MLSRELELRHRTDLLCERRLQRLQPILVDVMQLALLLRDQRADVLRLADGAAGPQHACRAVVNVAESAMTRAVGLDVRTVRPDTPPMPTPSEDDPPPPPAGVFQVPSPRQKVVPDAPDPRPSHPTGTEAVPSA